MIDQSLAEKLAALEERYLHELLPEGERLELRERIASSRRRWPPPSSLG